MKQENASSLVNAASFLVFGLAASWGVFVGGAYGAIGIIGALLMWGAVTITDRRPAFPDRTMLLFCLAVLVMITALLPFAAWPRESNRETLQAVSIILPLLLLASPRVQERVARNPCLFSVLPWLLAFFLLALAVEHVLKAPVMRYFSPGGWESETGNLEDFLTRYNRGISYALMLGWAVAGALWSKGKRHTALFLALAFVPALALTESSAAQAALAGAVLVVALASFAPALTRWLLSAGILVSLSWPAVTAKLFLLCRDGLKALPESWHTRMEIWDFLSYRIPARPFLGWGMGGTPQMLPAGPNGALYEYVHEPVGHPHNAVIQLWLEHGILGPVLGVVFALLMLRRASRLPRSLVPFAFGAWTVAFALSLVAYDFWSDSLLAAFALTAFAFSVAAKRLEKPDHENSP